MYVQRSVKTLKPLTGEVDQPATLQCSAGKPFKPQSRLDLSRLSTPSMTRALSNGKLLLQKNSSGSAQVTWQKIKVLIIHLTSLKYHMVKHTFVNCKLRPQWTGISWLIRDQGNLQACSTPFALYQSVLWCLKQCFCGFYGSKAIQMNARMQVLTE